MHGLKRGVIASNTNQTHLLITTEDKEIVEFLRKQNESTTSRNMDPFQLVQNEFDLSQGTGSVKDVRDDYTLDHVMLSAFSSLKLQLLSVFTLANCCSNFHGLLGDLHREGCGVGPRNTFQCLQNHPNESFRLCCAWDRSDRCRNTLKK